MPLTLHQRQLVAMHKDKHAFRRSDALMHKNAALCSRVTKCNFTDSQITRLTRVLKIQLLVIVLLTSQQ